MRDRQEATSKAGRLLLTAVGLELAWHAVLFTADRGLPPLGTDAFPDLGATVVNIVAMLVPLAVIAWRGWWREPWLRTIVPRRPVVLVPALALALLPLIGGLDGSPSVLLSSAILFLALGCSEELLSRGTVQALLEPLAPVRRVLWVGVLFGIGHVLSALWFGRPLDDGAAQVISATTFGVGYAGMRMHTVSIWPLAVLHGLDDWTSVNSPGALPWGVQLAVAIAWMTYGVRLARARSAGPTPSSVAPVGWAEPSSSS
jgi:hypothetical protein